MEIAARRDIKLVIVGDCNIGKTYRFENSVNRPAAAGLFLRRPCPRPFLSLAFLITVTSGSFPGPYLPKIFENYSTTLTVDEKPYFVGLWDTHGSDDYDRLRSLCYPFTDVLIAAFSITDPKSFERISTKWIPELNEFCPKTPIILTGFQIDLRGDMAFNETLKEKDIRVITPQEGEALAAEFRDNNVVSYMECSSLTKVGLKELLEESVRAAVYVPNPSNEKKEKCLLM